MTKWLKIVIVAAIVISPLLPSVASASDGDDDLFSVIWGD